MKNHPIISAELYCKPWAIKPEAHQELGTLWRAMLAGKLQEGIPGPAALAMKAEDHAPKMEAGKPEWRCSGICVTRDPGLGIAIVELNGIVAKRDPNMWCGPRFVGMAELGHLCRDLAADDAVEKVFVYFSTPGGSVVGLEEGAAELRELAAVKPCVGYTDEECCSAGMYLSAQLDRFYAAPSAVVGSIGTYLAAVDDSRAWEMEGLELILFRVGDKKAAGHPGKKWTEEEKAHFEAMTQELGAEFREMMAERRGLKEEDMQGQWWMAKGAPAGMVDGHFNSLEDLVAAELEE